MARIPAFKVKIDPKVLFGEELFRTVRPENITALSKQIQIRTQEMESRLKRPAIFLFSGLAALILGQQFDWAIFILGGGLTSFLFGYGLLFSLISASHIPRLNRGISNTLELMVIRKSEGMPYPSFYEKYLRYWSPSLVVKQLRKAKLQKIEAG